MDDSTPPPFGAARDAEVRRLLAAARHDGPPPTEVVDRLDATLAELVAERAGSRPGADRDVVPLKRRRWTTGLLAAAAVTVIGLGTTQVIFGTGSSEDAMTAADSAGMDQDDSAENDGQEGAGGDAEAPTASLDDDRDRGSRAPEPTFQNGDVLEDIPLRQLQPLDGVTLQSDLKELTADLRGRAYANEDVPEGFSYTAAERRAVKVARVAGCGPAAPPAATLLLAARFRGDPAVVAVRMPWPGYRVAEVYPCPPGSPSRTPARSVLLLPG